MKNTSNAKTQAPTSKAVAETIFQAFDSLSVVDQQFVFTEIQKIARQSINNEMKLADDRMCFLKEFSVKVN